MVRPEFERVFDTLRRILAAYEPDLAVQSDDPDSYHLDTSRRVRGKPFLFGAVRLGKSYVSFHLMPVYVFPALLAGISPALKARMHGKSCFNFSRVEDVPVNELVRLTRAAFERYSAEGMV